MTDPLVSVEWLAENIKQVVVLDATYYLPPDPERSRSDFLTERVPGAQLFEIDKVADQTSDLPHMLPSEEDFAQAMAALGIDGSCPVVVYDRSANHFSAPRVWYMLRLFGLQNCFVLDGGLNAWKAAGQALASGDATSKAAPVRTWQFSSAYVLSGKKMAQVVASGKETILDARAQDRFDGKAPEPRPGLSSGHMPGATCTPFTSMTDESGQFVSQERLAEIFNISGVTLPIVTCGSGMTACTLALGLERIGIQARLYDGSWADWGQGTLGPIETA